MGRTILVANEEHDCMKSNPVEKFCSIPTTLGILHMVVIYLERLATTFSQPELGLMNK